MFQLSSLLHKFKSVHLQEHLLYVLANADVRSMEPEPRKGATKRRPDFMSGKDMRSSLYKRIGVLKPESGNVTLRMPWLFLQK